MIKYILLIVLSLPLLACADEATPSKSSAIKDQIDTVISGKSNQTNRQYWRPVLNWSAECEEDFQYPDSVSGVDIYPIKDNQYIIQIMCTMGSYQGRQQFFHLTINGDKASVKAMKFPLYEINKKQAVLKESTSELWGNVLNNSDYNKFTILNQYSGYGHCGTLTTYKIINGEVTATKLRAQPDCESKKASRNPNKWPEYAIP